MGAVVVSVVRTASRSESSCKSAGLSVVVIESSEVVDSISVVDIKSSSSLVVDSSSVEGGSLVAGDVDASVEASV